MLEHGERRQRWTYDRVMLWITLAGVVYAVVAFYAQARTLPERVSTVEEKFVVHCATQAQYEKDLSENLKEIKGMLHILVRGRDR